MKIVNVADPSESITITSPLSSASLKGCHEVQNLGAVETYQRRYLWVAALEIVEHDAIDSGEPAEPKTGKPEPKVDKPDMTEQQKEDLNFFADAVTEYVVITKTVEGLNSYWIANQQKLDELKVKLPDQYERVLNVFRDRKTQLQGEKK